MTSPIYLSAPLRDDARARRLAAGIKALHSGTEVRLLGPRLPDVPLSLMEPATVAGVRRYAMAGSGPAPLGGFGPHAMCRVPTVAPVAAVWVAGPDCPECADDAAAAKALGIPVRRLGADEAAGYEDAGRRAMMPVLAPVVAEEEERPDFRGARSIVKAYFDGMALLDVQGIAYDRSPGDGNAHGVQARIATATARLAKARGVMRAAHLHPDALPPEDRPRALRALAILRAVVVEGRSQEVAGDRAELSQSAVSRLLARVYGDIAHALDEYERDHA